MAIFSCRAECQDDLDGFINAAKRAGVEMSIRAYPDQIFPDVDIEIEAQATKEILKGLLSESDAHVMRQTLRAVPLAENSLELDLRVK